jgi:hypothetical protein
MTNMDKINQAIRSIESVKGRLRAMASKVSYVLGHDSALINDLVAEADSLEYYTDYLKAAIDADLQQQLKEAQTTVGGILHDLVGQSKQT